MGALQKLQTSIQTLIILWPVYPIHTRGGHRGLLETEKPRKKSLKTAKPQEISSKTENRIKLLTHKPLVVLRISLSVLNFNTYKLILISDVLPWLFPC